MRLIGIDPGKDGALAELVVGPQGAHVAAVARLPWRDIGKAHEVLNLREVHYFLRGGEAHEPSLVVIEELTYMPVHGGQAGLLDFMREYGKILGLLELHYRFHTVRPQNWQAKVVGVINHDPLPKPAEKGQPTKGEKQALEAARRKRVQRTKGATLAAVQRLYPEANLVPVGCKVPHAGVVDAVALAHYGWVHVLNATRPPRRAKAV